MNARFDTIRQVMTPEGVELDLHIAGPIARARAWFYDLLIRMLIWAALGLSLSFFKGFGFGIFMVCAFLLEWFYPILFEVYMSGQTPGKRAGKLAVIRDDGRPVDWNASFIRNTVRFADFFPFLYALGMVACVLNKDGKRLGDLAAGTVVVYIDSARALSLSQAEEVSGAIPPPVSLSLEEQQSIIEYRLRASRLTEERSLELSAIPSALTGDGTLGAAKEKLMKIGNFLLGRR